MNLLLYTATSGTKYLSGYTRSRRQEVFRSNAYYIIIIGSGTVGIANWDGFQRFGNDVVFYDTDDERLQKLERMGFHITSNISGENVDAFFVCTPVYPIEDAIYKLPYKDSLVVIRSSVLPGTTSMLIQKNGGGHIAVNPEFLREATAINDFLNPFRIVYSACCQQH